jgi:hypothetical protein
MKKTLVAFGTLAVALGAALAQDSQPFGECPLAHANPKESPAKVPFGDKKKMEEFQGLDGTTKAKVEIDWPKEDETIPEGKGEIKFKVDGYEIGKDPKGHFQHCHVILDNKPYFAAYGAGGVKLEAVWSGNADKPEDVPEGTHILTIFPARNFHLSVKNEGACAQVRFHVKSKKGEVPGPKDPQLVYSRPKGAYDSALSENKAIMLDFYLLNAKLAPDGDRVHASVTKDGKEVGKPLVITEWWPQIILKDAEKGDYEVTIELQDKDGKPVKGPFNKTARKVTVK